MFSPASLNEVPEPYCGYLVRGISCGKRPVLSRCQMDGCKKWLCANHTDLPAMAANRWTACPDHVAQVAFLDKQREIAQRLRVTSEELGETVQTSRRKESQEAAYKKLIGLVGE